MRNQSVRPRAAPSLPVQPQGRRLRIMLVDDEPSVVRALQRALREHELVVAFSGAEAIEVLDSGQHFVFMTGGAFTQQAKDFLSGVENPVVEKPFDIRALRVLVSRRVAA